MAEDVSTGLTVRAAGRRFGLTVGGAFLAFSVIALWRDHPTAVRVLGTLGAVLVISALFVPTALGPVERGWMAIAHAMSRVTTPIVMSVLFFVIITPIGLARRAFGRRGLAHAKHGESAWHPRADGKRRSDLNRQF
ncbi:MAG: hypothetical protein ABI877_12510 [Gemmatimonadaceae bacterium]